MTADQFPLEPPSPTIVHPNPAFEDWVLNYAQAVCSVSHEQSAFNDRHLIDPCEQHRREARQVAYQRLDGTDQ